MAYPAGGIYNTNTGTQAVLPWTGFWEAPHHLASGRGTFAQHWGPVYSLVTLASQPAQPRYATFNHRRLAPSLVFLTTQLAQPRDTTDTRTLAARQTDQQCNRNLPHTTHQLMIGSTHQSLQAQAQLQKPRPRKPTKYDAPTHYCSQLRTQHTNEGAYCDRIHAHITTNGHSFLRPLRPPPRPRRRAASTSSHLGEGRPSPHTHHITAKPFTITTTTHLPRTHHHTTPRLTYHDSPL